MPINKRKQYNRSLIDVCRNCHGYGSVDGSTCGVCDGRGIVHKEISLTITIDNDVRPA